MGSLTPRSELTEAQLVQDLSRLLLVEVITYLSLASGEPPQRGRRQPREVGQCLEARDQAVATEERHEPRQSGRGQCRALGEVWVHTKRAEIAEAGPVGAHEGRVV